MDHIGAKCDLLILDMRQADEIQKQIAGCERNTTQHKCREEPP